MNKRKVPYIFLVLLIFALTITGCNPAERPNPEDNYKRPEPMQNNTDTNTSLGTDEDTSLPRAKNDAEVNNERTRDNAMPSRPQHATPDSSVGFTLNQINEFELDIELTNKDKMYMKYKKGPSNEESKVETVFDGKREKTEHEEASRQIEELLRKIPGSSISNTNTIIDGTLSALNIKREDVVEFDMEFVFETGERVHIELNED